MCPVLRGENHCPHCLCVPCVNTLPPDFLKGSCDPHLANAEKRHRLYNLFWWILSDIGVWRDPEYLQRKEERTVRDDCRDIHPPYVIQVIHMSSAHIGRIMYTQGPKLRFKSKLPLWPLNPLFRLPM